ncbi:putative membrane protein [Microbacterium sp. SORGH_AS428]|nr:putative membrane protein [Microbacterium sp. SORGH_AS_0428]
MRGACHTSGMGFLIRVVVNAFSIWVVTLIPVLGVSVIAFPPGGTLEIVLSLLIVALVFALVNTIVGSVVKVIAFPLYVLTLGLFSLVVNGFLLWLTSWITEFWDWGLRVESFWWGVVAALVIAVINGIFGVILRPKRRD